MKQLIVASEEPTVARALAEFLRLWTFAQKLTYSIECPTLPSFASLWDHLDEIRPEQLAEAVLVIDLTRDGTGPFELAQRVERFGIFSELVLSYPELFVIAVTNSVTASMIANKWAEEGSPELDTLIHSGTLTDHIVQLRDLQELRHLLQRHATGFRTVFDPTGVRSVQKLILASADPETIYKPRIAVRLEKRAVVGDDEEDFLYLNAYAAFRSGYAVFVCDSKAEVVRLHEATRAKTLSVDLGIWDWQLSYPDLAGKRTDVMTCESLKATEIAPKNIIVTAAPGAVPPRYRTIGKPFAGLFALISQIDQEASETKNDHVAAVNASLVSGHHSLPYVISRVAARLVSRAHRTAAVSDQDTVSFIRSAVLAIEAKELLDGLSRTTCYEVLSLQYESETMAELSFLGISDHVDVSPRLDDLQKEAALIAERGGSGDLKAVESELSYDVQSIGRLRLLFIRYEQVLAAEECLRRVSKIANTLESQRIRADWKHLVNSGTSHKSPCPSLLGILKRFFGHLGQRYVDETTGSGTSVASLVLVSFLWVMIFACAYRLLHGIPFGLAWRHSILTFVQVSVGQQEVVDIAVGSHPVIAFMSFTAVTAEMILSWLHLGLLISVLHRRVTRRTP